MKKRFFMWSLMLIISLLVTQTSVTSAENGFHTVTKVSYFDAPWGNTYRVEQFQSIHYLGASEGNESILTSCLELTHGVHWYYGERWVWTYSWRTTWCYDGDKITMLRSNRVISIGSGNWSFKGDIYHSAYGGVGQGSYYHYDQGDICFINMGSFCVGHV